MKNMSAGSYLDFAALFAKKMSGCVKVQVGSVLVQNGQMVAFGANRAIPDLCTTKRGCLRVERYGDDSKAHRNPEDCRAIHSEIDAICSAASLGVCVEGADLFVTRYPCEGCAKAIVTAGIRRVYYGGTTHPSQWTIDLFKLAGVTCCHVNGWSEDNTDR